MSFSISGRTAIVTGAGEGLGLAVARHFAEAGANVVFAGDDEAALQAAVAEFGSGEEGSPVRAVVTDIRSKLSLANLVSSTLDAFDRIDILVNAAREVEQGVPLDPEGDRVGPMLEANLMSALRLSQMVARRMIARAERAAEVGAGPAGAIVNVTGLAAARTVRGLMGCAVAAAALEQTTRSLALALAPHRIRVNGLSVAGIESPALVARMKAEPGLRAAMVEAVPLGRIAAPSEIGGAAQFLASDASAFCTGQILTFDGGRSLLSAGPQVPEAV